jgi:two-component system sensor histidine kinase KdpD
MVHLSYAVGIVAASTLILILFRGILSTSIIALLYLIPVGISATFWGRLSGITTSVISFLAYNYFFLPPFYTFRVAHPQDFLVMIVMLMVAGLISSLMARVQTNLTKAQAREREALQLNKLSLDLTGRHDQAHIAEILARHLSEFFQTCMVEVEVFGMEKSTIATAPEDHQACFGEPDHQIEIASKQGLLGEIRVWGISRRLSPEEGRLLETCSNQAALALDRAILDASETRARILEESDRLKTAILSSVSHDLRTPLATIQTSATTLFNPSLSLASEARTELESLLLEEIDRMIQLVGNLLNMSRIEAGALKLHRQWNDLTEIVDNCTKRLRNLSSRHRIELDISETLPLISVDSVLMEQVFINLVSNSLKFAPPQSTIRISAKADEQALQVTVSNQGPPIPEDYLDHVFEKFYPIPGRQNAEGIGLGLSICQGIIEAHGGKIKAVNLPEGVAFTFTIPLPWDGTRPILPEEEGEEV